MNGGRETGGRGGTREARWETRTTDDNHIQKKKMGTNKQTPKQLNCGRRISAAHGNTRGQTEGETQYAPPHCNTFGALPWATAMLSSRCHVNCFCRSVLASGSNGGGRGVRQNGITGDTQKWGRATSETESKAQHIASGGKETMLAENVQGVRVWYLESQWRSTSSGESTMIAVSNSSWNVEVEYDFGTKCTCEVLPSHTHTHTSTHRTS